MLVSGNNLTGLAVQLILPCVLCMNATKKSSGVATFSTVMTDVP